MPVIMPPAEPYYLLELDAVFLASARRHVRYTRPPHAKLKTLTRRLDRLESELDGLDPYEDYDTMEPLSIQMSGAYDELTAAYSPSLRHCTQANVLAALAVEAHVNRRVLELIRGKTAREKLFWEPIHDRVQKLLERTGSVKFAANRKPFTDLKGLIRRRHALVHYRPQPLAWSDTRAPKVPKKLGLTRAVARQSVQVAEDFIEALCNRLGKDVPYWVRKDAYNFFVLQFG